MTSRLEHQMSSSVLSIPNRRQRAWSPSFGWRRTDHSTGAEGVRFLKIVGVQSEAEFAEQDALHVRRATTPSRNAKDLYNLWSGHSANRFIFIPYCSPR